MFKKELQRRLGEIFGLEKTTFYKNSPMNEQDVLYIVVGVARCRVTRTHEVAIVEGSFFINSQESDLHYGFFSKQIDKAPKHLLKNLFFYGMEENIVEGDQQQDLIERKASFLFLYKSEYNPNQGQITELSMECCQ